MKGKKVILRDEIRESDDKDLFRWLNMEEWNYYDEPDRPFTGITPEQFQVLLEKRQEYLKKASNTSHRWQVDTTEGRHIGWVNYYQLDKKRKFVFVGICLPEEDVWGKGYGTEAVSLLVDHLFQETEMAEVRVSTWTGNRRMMRCAEKCGFKESERMPHRKEYSVRGEPLERIVYSMSRVSWAARRGKDE